MSNDEHAIRIRLDISIPRDGRSVEVDTGAVRPPSPDPPPATAIPQPLTAQPLTARPLPEQRLSILGVTVPAANTQHLVKTTGGSGIGGVICSYGHCDGISPTPDEVILHCNSGTPVTADLDTSAHWSHEAVPGATCSSDTANLPFNALTVRYKYRGKVIYTDEVPFYGLCSSSTGCEEDKATTANRFLPTNYLVVVDGFSQALSHFNGRWPLRVLPCRIDDAEIRWQHKLPAAAGSVELIGKPACQSAQLVFRDDIHEVRYKKPKGSWHPMNVADFANCHSVVVPPGAAVPAIVQVELA